jgi:Holliday junction resolvase
MRRAAKVDANQGQVVEALRKAGCTVQLLHAVGGGCPDLLVSCQGQVLLIEVKDGSKPPSAQKLTPDQITWHAGWQAQVHIVNSVEQALEVVEQYKRRAA